MGSLFTPATAEKGARLPCLSEHQSCSLIFCASRIPSVYRAVKLSLPSGSACFVTSPTSPKLGTCPYALGHPHDCPKPITASLRPSVIFPAITAGTPYIFPKIRASKLKSYASSWMADATQATLPPLEFGGRSARPREETYPLKI